MFSNPGPAPRHSQKCSEAPTRSQALPDVPRRRQDAPKTPKRPPRSPQDPQDDPKSTPKRPHVGTSGTSQNQQKHVVSDDFLRIQPLLFTLCSMLIKNGLKMSSRSLQERSKMPQDVQRPPTWGQHGANMGSKKAPRSVQGGSNCFPEGVTSSDCCPTANMDPKCPPNEPQMDPIHLPLWRHLGSF